MKYILIFYEGKFFIFDLVNIKNIKINKELSAFNCLIIN